MQIDQDNSIHILDPILGWVHDIISHFIFIFYTFFKFIIIYFFITFLFHFHLTNMNTVAKYLKKYEVERAKYSEPIICLLIKYIYFRIKSKL